jgi:hypothetical protein
LTLAILVGGQINQADQGCPMGQVPVSTGLGLYKTQRDKFDGTLNGVASNTINTEQLSLIQIMFSCSFRRLFGTEVKLVIHYMFFKPKMQNVRCFKKEYFIIYYSIFKTFKFMKIFKKNIFNIFNFHGSSFYQLGIKKSAAVTVHGPMILAEWSPDVTIISLRKKYI